METNTQSAAGSQVRETVRIPKMYAVIMFNDDITTMDFVVELLVKVFHKSPVEATAVMTAIHENGQGIAGIYTYDIAVTKKNYADQLSAEKGFPLKLAVQEAEWP